MTPVTAASGKPLLLSLQPGQTATLPGGRGSVTFDGVDRFAGLSVRYDPGKQLALAGSLAALAGLVCSLTIRRRRIFVRARLADTPTVPGPPNGHHVAHGASTQRTVITIGGLAKGEDAHLSTTLDAVLTALTRSNAAH